MRELRLQKRIGLAFARERENLDRVNSLLWFPVKEELAIWRPTVEIAELVVSFQQDLFAAGTIRRFFANGKLS